MLALLRRQRTTVSITPEYRYRMEGFRNRSLARCDIWITIRGRKDAALVIIENKIGAPEGKDQFEWYERKAREWCKRNKGQSLLVYCRTAAPLFGSEISLQKSWFSLKNWPLDRSELETALLNQGASISRDLLSHSDGK